MAEPEATKGAYSMMTKNSQKSAVVVCIGLFLLLGGCASEPALKKSMTEVDVSQRSIALIGIRTVNQYKPQYKPYIGTIKVRSIPGKKTSTISVKTHIKSDGDDILHLVSIQLEPGEFEISSLMGGAAVFLIGGQFAWDPSVRFELKPNEIAYVGHIDMVHRKKKSGERSSGGLFPLIDQIVSGFADGTFDVTVSMSDEDLAAFHAEYPVLDNYAIVQRMALKETVGQPVLADD